MAWQQHEPSEFEERGGEDNTPIQRYIRETDDSGNL